MTVEAIQTVTRMNLMRIGILNQILQKIYLIRITAKQLYFKRMTVFQFLLQRSILKKVLFILWSCIKKPDNVRLGMVIEIKAEKFIYRTFFIRGSKMKTYHEGAKDAEFEYNEV